MTKASGDTLHWLQTRPFQDHPGWVEASSEEMPGTWDEWVQKGREIPDVESHLIFMLEHDPDPVIRSAAALALGFVGGDGSLKPLIKALETDVPLVAMEAAAALGRLGRPEAVEPLCAALKSTDANVRANACTAVGSLGGEKALSCLREAEQDTDPFVQAAAKEALRRAG